MAGQIENHTAAPRSDGAGCPASPRPARFRLFRFQTVTGMKGSAMGILYPGKGWLAAIGLFALSACGDHYMPKPRGYFRIDLPEPKYAAYEAECPFTCNLPVYTRLEVDPRTSGGDTCRFNIVYPKFRARIHCTYLPIRGNADRLVEDAYGFAASHEVKATALRRTPVSDPERRVYGIVYDIEGEVASQAQFFLMDSTRHFLRGSLYFNHRPNPDSIAPVLARIRQDIAEIAASLRWTGGQ